MGCGPVLFLSEPQQLGGKRPFFYLSSSHSLIPFGPFSLSCICCFSPHPHHLSSQLSLGEKRQAHVVSMARVMLHELASPRDTAHVIFTRSLVVWFPEMFNAQLAYCRHLSRHSHHPSINAGVGRTEKLSPQKPVLCLKHKQDASALYHSHISNLILEHLSVTTERKLTSSLSVSQRCNNT